MMSRRAGRIPLVLLALLAFYLASRPLFQLEEPPAFFAHDPPRFQVGLTGDWSQPGVHHFFDDSPEACVNELTSNECAQFWELLTPLVNGREYRVNASGMEVSTTWLPAAQRIALQIPLHPDRMDISDWEVLPGIGPRLAEKIEIYRQKNGDIGSLNALKQVNGIGDKRINGWRRFFKEL